MNHSNPACRTRAQGSRWACIALAGVFALGLGAGSAVAGQESVGANSNGTGATFGSSPDPSRVLGPRQCSECHEAETKTWRESNHHLGAKVLPRNKEAQKIAAALGIRRIRADSRCTMCHYTVQQLADGRAKTVAGVSCESCHGAARDWVKVHDDYGAEEETPESELAEHRAARWAECDAKGMRRPGRLYDLVSQCYRCHTIGHREVVDVGRHPTLTDFELVASQVKIHHHFVQGEKEPTPTLSPARQRIMFVLGRGLELEYALHALARASQPGPFAAAMIARADQAIEGLKHIKTAAEIREVDEMLALARALELTPENSDAIERVAGKIAAAAQRFEAQSDGATLSGLDKLLPKPDSGGPTAAMEP